jgi:hypothetical protein
VLLAVHGWEPHAQRTPAATSTPAITPAK